MWTFTASFFTAFVTITFCVLFIFINVRVFFLIVTLHVFYIAVASFFTTTASKIITVRVFVSIFSNYILPLIVYNEEKLIVCGGVNHRRTEKKTILRGEDNTLCWSEYKVRASQVPESADDCVHGAHTPEDHSNGQTNHLRQDEWGLQHGKHHYGNYIVNAESSEFKFSSWIMVDMVGIYGVVDIIDESDLMILREAS